MEVWVAQYRHSFVIEVLMVARLRSRTSDTAPRVGWRTAATKPMNQRAR